MRVAFCRISTRPCSSDAAAAHPTTEVHSLKWAAAQRRAGLDLLAELPDVLLHARVLHVCRCIAYASSDSSSSNACRGDVMDRHTCKFGLAAYSLDREVAIETFFLAEREVQVGRPRFRREHGAVIAAADSLLSVRAMYSCNRIPAPDDSDGAM